MLGRMDTTTFCYVVSSTQNFETINLVDYTQPVAFPTINDFAGENRIRRQRTSIPTINKVNISSVTRHKIG
jgi:hypothetical protein